MESTQEPSRECAIGLLGEEEGRQPGGTKALSELDILTLLRPPAVPNFVLSSHSMGNPRWAFTPKYSAYKPSYLFSTVLLQAVEEMASIGEPKGQHLKIFQMFLSRGKKRQSQTC